MNHLVKITVNDDGDETLDTSWHLVDPTNRQGDATFCTQEFFGIGESACKFETKTVNRGGITCPACLIKIRTIKAIKI